MLKTQLFDYHLPKEAIALYPPRVRGRSKLMVLYTKPFRIEHRCYCDIPDYIRQGDIVVLNNTRVIKARLFGIPEGRKSQVEVLLLNPTKPFRLDTTEWEVLISPAKKLKGKRIIEFDLGYSLEILERTEHRTFVVRFNAPPLKIAQDLGRIPIPKYLKRQDEQIDYDRYNTIFAKIEGSVAAPTASLNLTPEILERIKQKAKVVYVTLYVGWGTFAPVDTEFVEDFKIHSEFGILPKSTAQAINNTKAQGGYVFAFGTTVTRVLEGTATKFGSLKPYKGEFDIFIYPGYKFKVVDRLITNFHAPKSSVLMLASAFAGIENIKRAYGIALKKGYKFLSYGDSMLIIP